MDALVPFTTSGQLIDCVDSQFLFKIILICIVNQFVEKMLVALRDGRKIIGVLRTFDQFGQNCFQFLVLSYLLIIYAANLVLNDSVERIHVDNEYADIPRGLFLIRGENVVLMGEVVSDMFIYYFLYILNLLSLGSRCGR